MHFNNKKASARLIWIKGDRILRWDELGFLEGKENFLVVLTLGLRRYLH